MFGKILKHTLYVGLNDKDKHKQLIEPMKAQDIINKILNNNGIDGATFIGSKGIYKAEVENSFKIEILFAKDKQIINTIEQIKKELNQESVAVTREKIVSNLL
jgi:hypothetical protein